MPQRFFKTVRPWACLAVSAAIIGPASAKEIAVWSFDQPTRGGAFAIGLVEGREAQAYNNPAAVSKGPGVTGLALRLDNAGRKDRDGAVLTIPDDDRLTGHADDGEGFDSLTIAADVRIDGHNGQAQVVRKIDDTYGYELYILESGRVGFRIKGDKGVARAHSKNTLDVSDGEWHHIQGTFDASRELYNMQVVVDGVVTRKTRHPGRLTNTQAPLTIGGFVRAQDNVGQRFDGWIDNVSISTGRVNLLDKSGIVDPEPVTPTGSHLLDQPGLVSARFIADPPPTPECHAGTIAQRPDGGLVAAWFGGTCEGHVDVGVWQSECDGRSWSTPHQVAASGFTDGAQGSIFNPVLFQYPDGGPMLLFYMQGPLGSAKGMLKRSHDGGRTWSKATPLPQGVDGATKNKPVLLDNGVLLCPDNSSTLRFDRTDDYGKTWLEPSVVPNPKGLGAIQPTILVHEDGRLQALGRSQCGSIVTSWSEDNGVTWSPLERTNLPNNYSGIDAVTLADGRHLLVYNHSATPEGAWGGPRTPLNVAVSEDGVHWQAALVLEDERGEYSYPGVIQTDDGKVHVIYTWHRTRMKHAVLDPSKFDLRPITDGRWPQP